jgi:hypothetical protein
MGLGRMPDGKADRSYCRARGTQPGEIVGEALPQNGRR